MPSLSQHTLPPVSIGLLVVVVAIGGTVGALMTDLSARIAAAVLRSFGEPILPDPKQCRERVCGALVCAIVPVMALTTHGMSLHALADCVLCLSLLVAADIDRRHHLLPDVITLPLLCLGLLVNLGDHIAPLHDAVVGAVSGYLGLRFLSLVVTASTGADGIGHGDFKLVAALGAWLGWQALPSIVLIAAALVVLVGLVRAARLRMRIIPRMPFGPALAAAATVVLFAPPLRH